MWSWREGSGDWTPFSRFDWPSGSCVSTPVSIRSPEFYTTPSVQTYLYRAPCLVRTVVPYCPSWTRVRGPPGLRRYVLTRKIDNIVDPYTYVKKNLFFQDFVRLLKNLLIFKFWWLFCMNKRSVLWPKVSLIHCTGPSVSLLDYRFWS